MRKPNQPFPPQIPVEPLKQIVLTELQVRIYSSTESNVADLIASALSQYNNEKNVYTEGDWRITSIIVSDDGYNNTEIVVKLTGGKLTYDNSAYNFMFKQYQKLSESYAERLEKFNIKQAEYDKWVAEQKPIIDAKKTNELKKKISSLERELKKLKTQSPHPVDLATI